MRRFVQFVWNDLKLKWLITYLVVSLLIWGALPIFDAQGLFNRGMKTTWSLLRWMLNLDAPAFFHDWVVDWCNRLPYRINISGQNNHDGEVFKVWLFWADLAVNLWLLFVIAWVLVWLFRSLFTDGRGSIITTPPTATIITPAAATTAPAGGGATAATTVNHNYAPTNREDVLKKIASWVVPVIVVALALKLVGDQLLNNTIPRIMELLRDPTSRPESQPSTWSRFAGFLFDGLLIASVITAVATSVLLTSRLHRSGRGGAPWTTRDTIFLVGSMVTLVSLVFVTSVVIRLT